MAKKENGFADQIQELLLMKQENLKEYGCLIYCVVEEKGRFHRQINDNFYSAEGKGIPVKKVKSMEHFVQLMVGEGFAVLDEKIDFRYYNVEKSLDKV